MRFTLLGAALSICVLLIAANYLKAADNAPAAKAAAFSEVSNLPDQKEQPDPLVGSDGKKIASPDQWKTHREEMKRVVEHYHYLTGTIPPAPGNVKGKVVMEKDVLDGKAEFQRVHLTFGPEEKLSFDVGIFVPVGAGPFPTVVNPSFFPTPAVAPAVAETAGETKNNSKGDSKSDGKSSDAKSGDSKSTAATDAKSDAKSDAKDGAKAPKGPGRFGRTPDPDTAARGFAEALNRGYAVCTFGYTQAGADDKNTWHDTGFFAAYPNYDWHDLGAWAWAMSRCIDYLETQPWADKSKFIALGHSRLGKTTLVAGAFDERFALVAPAGSGCAGTGAFRVNGKARTGKEGLEDVCKNFPQWVTPRLNDFSGQVEKLPFDQNCLIAMVAPRAFIEAEALDDGACNGKATKAAFLAARPTFEFLGVADNIGTHFRPGGHALAPDDWKAVLDFADWRLRGKPIEQKFDTFPPDEQLR